MTRGDTCYSVNLIPARYVGRGYCAWVAEDLATVLVGPVGYAGCSVPDWAILPSDEMLERASQALARMEEEQ